MINWKTLIRFEHAEGGLNTVATFADLLANGSGNKEEVMCGDGHFRKPAVQAPVVNCVPPTVDPKVKGALWNDNGVVSISAG